MKFDEYQGRVVVLDISSEYVVLGTLAGHDDRYFELTQADVHDLRDTNTTRELYVVEARKHGVSPNRKRVLVRREEVVSLSALDEIIL